MSSLLLLALATTLASLESVQAQNNCYRNIYGRVICRGGGLGYGARYGIGFGIAGAFLLIMILLLCFRRRKVHRANLVYAQQQQAEMGQNNYQPHHQSGLQGAFFPTYQNPQQQNTGMFNKFSRNEEDVQPPPPAYNPQQGQGPQQQQQQHYAPPQGPPPGQQENSVEAREWAQHQENLRAQQQGRQ